MNTQTVANRIRLGILALPVSTTVILVSIFISGGCIDPSLDLVAFAEQVSSTRFAFGDSLFTIGVLVAIFGFFSLYAYLANSRIERWAFIAMILCVVGVTSGLVGVGMESVQSVAGRLYLEGQQAFLEESVNLFNWSIIFLIITNALLFTVGLLLFGVAIWRSDTLPQGAAILWVAATVLASTLAVAGVCAVIDYVLFTIANAWIAWTVWRQPSAEVAGAEAEPRVQ